MDQRQAVVEPGAGAALPPRKVRRQWLWLFAMVAAVLAYNLSVWAPVASRLGDDDRNDVTSIHVYRTWLVHPRDVTVDLVAADGAAPVDLTRGLFQTAEALEGRRFGKVTLARQGKPVFVMDGADFDAMGRDYAQGENPIYLMRTLPEKLKRPDGQSAFGSWSGGWLGVLSRQMGDVNDFGRAWAEGRL